MIGRSYAKEKAAEEGVNEAINEHRHVTVMMRDLRFLGYLTGCHKGLVVICFGNWIISHD